MKRFLYHCAITLSIVCSGAVQATRIYTIENRTNHNIFIQNEDTEQYRGKLKIKIYGFDNNGNAQLALDSTDIGQQQFTLGPNQFVEFQNNTGTVPWESTQENKFISIMMIPNDATPQKIGFDKEISNPFEQNSKCRAILVREITQYEGPVGLQIKINESNGTLVVRIIKGQWRENCIQKCYNSSLGRNICIYAGTCADLRENLPIICEGKFFQEKSNKVIWQNILPGDNNAVYQIVVGPADNQFGIFPQNPNRIPNEKVPVID